MLCLLAVHNCSVTVLCYHLCYVCVVVERTYVSCLIQFRTFPFVYYKMCKYTLLLGFWWVVRVRLRE